MTLRTRFIFLTTICLMSTGARADALDVFNTIGNIAGAVSDSRQSLAEGRIPVPNLAAKGGSKHGGHEQTHTRKRK